MGFHTVSGRREAGPAGLYDRRHGYDCKLDSQLEQQIVQAKLAGRHRSARLIRDVLRAPVHEETVRRVLVKHHLERTSLPPVKPIQRFETAEPNELWPIDIQGEAEVPGPDAAARRGTSVRETAPDPGEDRDSVPLRPAGLRAGEPPPPRLRRAQRHLDAVDGVGNWQHRHKGLNGGYPADRYVRSLHHPTPEGLELLLIHEESRKVMRTGHISYYGQFYRVPDLYIGRRVWVILKGDTLRIECEQEVIATHQIKTDYLRLFRRDR